MEQDLFNPDDYRLDRLTAPAVVFEPDDQSIAGTARMLRHLAGLAATGKLTAPAAVGQGWWKGTPATCFAMGRDDFIRHKIGEHFAAKQDCVLLVDPAGPCELLWRDGTETDAGRLIALEAVDPEGCTIVGGRIYGTLDA